MPGQGLKSEWKGDRFMGGLRGNKKDHNAIIDIIKKGREPQLKGDNFNDLFGQMHAKAYLEKNKEYITGLDFKSNNIEEFIKKRYGVDVAKEREMFAGQDAGTRSAAGHDPRGGVSWQYMIGDLAADPEKAERVLGIPKGLLDSVNPQPVYDEKTEEKLKELAAYEYGQPKWRDARRKAIIAKGKKTGTKHGPIGGNLTEDQRSAVGANKQRLVRLIGQQWRMNESLRQRAIPKSLGGKGDKIYTDKTVYANMLPTLGNIERQRNRMIGGRRISDLSTAFVAQRRVEQLYAKRQKPPLNEHNRKPFYKIEPSVRAELYKSLPENFRPLEPGEFKVLSATLEEKLRASVGNVIGGDDYRRELSGQTLKKRQDQETLLQHQVRKFYSEYYRGGASQGLERRGGEESLEMGRAMSLQEIMTPTTRAGSAWRELNKGNLGLTSKNQENLAARAEIKLSTELKAHYQDWIDKYDGKTRDSIKDGALSGGELGAMMTMHEAIDKYGGGAFTQPGGGSTWPKDPKHRTMSQYHIHQMMKINKHNKRMSSIRKNLPASMVLGGRRGREGLKGKDPLTPQAIGAFNYRVKPGGDVNNPDDWEIIGTGSGDQKRQSGGFIGSALGQAIGREASAGIPMSRIRVTQDNKLKTGGNPMGLGVINTLDEQDGKVPFDRFDSVDQAQRHMGGGTLAQRGGLIPNYARPGPTGSDFKGLPDWLVRYLTHQMRGVSPFAPGMMMKRPSAFKVQKTRKPKKGPRRRKAVRTYPGSPAWMTNDPIKPWEKSKPLHEISTREEWMEAWADKEGDEARAEAMRERMLDMGGKMVSPLSLALDQPGSLMPGALTKQGLTINEGNDMYAAVEAHYRRAAATPNRGYGLTTGAPGSEQRYSPTEHHARMGISSEQAPGLTSGLMHNWMQQMMGSRLNVRGPGGMSGMFNAPGEGEMLAGVPKFSPFMSWHKQNLLPQMGGGDRYGTGAAIQRHLDAQAISHKGWGPGIQRNLLPMGGSPARTFPGADLPALLGKLLRDSGHPFDAQTQWGMTPGPLPYLLGKIAGHSYRRQSGL